MSPKKDQAWIFNSKGEVYLADVLVQGERTCSVRWFESDGEKRAFRVKTEMFSNKKDAIKRSGI